MYLSNFNFALQKSNFMSSKIFIKVAITIAMLLQSILIVKAQNYTSYFTGNIADVTTVTQAGNCLMGGATEDDNAMKWFLNRSGGGDIVVLRVTGGSGYNNYLFSNLGITVNSVETIVVPSIAAANNAYVKTQIRNAEAVFIAGGNQADYINFWKNTTVDSALNYLINIKKVPIGGTSAGMAIMGQAYNSAINGSVTSAEALANPFNTKITIGNNNFLHNPFLVKTITDTHFDNPDRRGRLTAFLARLITDSSNPQMAIACDEYTAVCIDETGLARVFGGFPTYDDNAYFIAVNCDVLNNKPETCVSGQPLNWNKSMAALKVYRIKGNTTGNNTFNTLDFKTAGGGVWQHWYVDNGVFNTDSVGINAPVCSAPLALHNDKNNVSSGTTKPARIIYYPNPAKDYLMVKITNKVKAVSVTNSFGFQVYKNNNFTYTLPFKINLNQYKTPLMFVIFEMSNGEKIIEKLITY